MIRHGRVRHDLPGGAAIGRGEQRLRRGLVVERLALLAEALAERVLAAVDDLLDGGLEPVVVLGEERVVRERPVDRVVEEQVIGVCAGNDLLDDLPCKGTGARGGVEASLWDGSILGTNDLEAGQPDRIAETDGDTDNTVEPLASRVSLYGNRVYENEGTYVSNADVTTAVVGLSP